MPSSPMSSNSTPSSPSTTRKRTSQQSPSMSTSDKISETANNLPPSRQSPAMRSVSAPLSSTRLSRLIYLLIGLTVLLGAFYSYRVLQYKKEVGGWWSLALGRTHAQMNTHTNSGSKETREGRGGKRGANEVEDRINALAEALGMPSNELASAIAGAVRAYVPPATLSSLAAKQTGEAVEVLLSQDKESEGKTAGGKTAGGDHPGMVEGMVNRMDSFVGMDEP